MIDTHCHIDFEDFDDDREDVVKRAKDKLDNVIVSGYSNDSNMKVLQLSKDYKDFIYPTFGFHPVSSQNATEEEIKTAHENVVKHLDEIVAIGEVGMDYFYVKDKSLREKQKEQTLFQGLLFFCRKTDLPMPLKLFFLHITKNLVVRL